MGIYESFVTRPNGHVVFRLLASPRLRSFSTSGWLEKKKAVIFDLGGVILPSPFRSAAGKSLNALIFCSPSILMEAAKKVFFLVARPLRGEGGKGWATYQKKFF